jgi:RNA 2',3'-cyclic 3'-phosphodiesterase
MIRTFIAVEISPEIRKNLGMLIENLKKGVHFTSSFPKWLKPDSIHLTLKFLGSIPESMVDEIALHLEAAAVDTPPFKIRVRDLGVFPDPKKPRVLWVGLTKGQKEICDLQQKIERSLIPSGFQKEKRPFHPHLTLARIKALRGASAFMNVVRIHKNSLVGECEIDRIILYKSELLPEGAKYTKLVETLLKGE